MDSDAALGGSRLQLIDSIGENGTRVGPCAVGELTEDAVEVGSVRSDLSPAQHVQPQVRVRKVGRRGVEVVDGGGDDLASDEAEFLGEAGALGFGVTAGVPDIETDPRRDVDVAVSGGGSRHESHLGTVACRVRTGSRRACACLRDGVAFSP